MARESKRKRDERRFGKAERLADRIRANGVHRPRWVAESDDSEWRPKADAFVTMIGQAPCIAIDNVTDYAGEHSESVEKWNSLPPCAPPFDMFWVESARPCPWYPELTSFGVFFIQCNRDQALKNLGRLEVRLNPGFSQRYPLSLADSSRYLVSTSMAVELGGRILYSTSDSTIFLGDRGEFLVPPMKTIPFSRGAMEDEQSQMPLLAMYNIALLSVGFMNCKNVARNAVEPDAKLNRERHKAGLKPFLRYHTINIDPMKRVLRTEGGIETNGLQKALHICRGHFATYGDSFMGRKLDEPITVWRPSHVRGSAKQGVVVSDYNVKAPT